MPRVIALLVAMSVGWASAQCVVRCSSAPCHDEAAKVPACHKPVGHKHDHAGSKAGNSQECLAPQGVTVEKAALADFALPETGELALARQATLRDDMPHRMLPALGSPPLISVLRI